MKIGIVNRDTEASNLIVKKVEEKISEYGYIRDDDNPDIVFFIGGDGTLLRAVQKYVYKIKTIKFIGIDESTLGFFYEFKEKDIPLIFEKISTNNYVTSSHRLLKGQMNNNVFYALNEIRLENPFYTLICETYIDGEQLETFHGTGLLMCSTLGSSAYNKSLNGALVDYRVDALQLSEIATIQNNVYRSLGNSLILPQDSNIKLVGNFNNVVVGYDHLSLPADNLTELTVSLSQKKITFIHKDKFSSIKAFKRSFVK